MLESMASGAGAGVGEEWFDRRGDVGDSVSVDDAVLRYRCCRCCVSVLQLSVASIRAGHCVDYPPTSTKAPRRSASVAAQRQPLASSSPPNPTMRTTFRPHHAAQGHAHAHGTHAHSMTNGSTAKTAAAAPAAPPARPHSAHRQMSIPSGLFRTSSGASGTRPSSVRRGSRREPEWEDEDAWDASSDRSDDEAGPSFGRMTSRPQSMSMASNPSRPTSVRPASIAERSGMTSPTGSRPASGARSPKSRATPLNRSPERTTTKAAPIPIKGRPTAEDDTECGSISTSWVTASYRPTPLDAPAGYQPLQVEVEAAEVRPGSLSTGGAWEMVEPREADPLTPVGAEALRADAEDVVKGESCCASGAQLCRLCVLANPRPAASSLLPFALRAVVALWTLAASVSRRLASTLSTHRAPKRAVHAYPSR